MSSLINKFLNKVDFKSYDDFKNNFELNTPEHFNFGFDVVDEYAKTNPEKIALIWENDTEKHVFNFKDMKKKSNQTANFFKRLGIKKGDAVMLTLKNRYEFWFSMIALHKIGAIAIPATHMLKFHDIDFRIKNADIKLIVTVKEDRLIPDYEETEKELGIKLNKVVIDEDIDGWYNFHNEIEKESNEYNREYLNENNDPLIIYFTSGTSGLPKMVMHSHTYPLAHIITAKYWHDVVEDGLHHTSADTGWGKAVWGNLYGQWIAGTGIYIYDYVRFNGVKLIEKLVENKVNTFCAPPTIYRFLIKEDIENYDFSNIKHATTAGEPLPGEVAKQFKEKTGLEIKQGFGQTETTLVLGTFIWNKSKEGFVGKPSPLYDVHLLDNNDKEVDVGDEGEICIKIKNKTSEGLLLEYYKDSEKMAKSFKNGFYHCGDNAWIDEEGYYHFVGRNDDIIKSSGYRIGPYEVESAVLSHKAVFNCAITGYPDELRGQIVKASIILQEGYEESDELIKDIQNHVKNITAPYKYPRMIEFVNELPETINGKIRRIEIRNHDENRKSFD